MSETEGEVTRSGAGKEEIEMREEQFRALRVFRETSGIVAMISSARSAQEHREHINNSCVALLAELRDLGNQPAANDSEYARTAMLVLNTLEIIGPGVVTGASCQEGPKADIPRALQAIRNRIDMHGNRIAQLKAP